MISVIFTRSGGVLPLIGAATARIRAANVIAG
jgi:hypothetical protein